MLRSPIFWLLGVLLALLGIAAVGRFVFEDFDGPNELVVWAPESQDVQVSFDGARPVTVNAGRFWVFDAKRGRHQLDSTVGTEKFTLTLELPFGRARYVAPVTARQCFAVADVTELYVLEGTAHREAGPPRIEARLVAHQAEKLPKGTFVGSSPDSTFRSGPKFLVKPFDCDELKVGDEQLLMMMNLG